MVSSRREPVVEGEDGREAAPDRHGDGNRRPLDPLGSTVQLLRASARPCCCIAAHLWRLRYACDGCVHPDRLGVARAARRGDPAHRHDQERVRRAGRRRPARRCRSCCRRRRRDFRAVDTLHALAVAHDLSLDWLVGLSNAGPLEAELLTQTSFAGARTVDDGRERLLGGWARRRSYKIRYVPSTLPDLLKTEAVIRFERAGAGGPDVAQTIETPRPSWRGRAIPTRRWSAARRSQGIASFARARASGAGSASRPRRQQLDHLIELVEELYPTFRWFLFDGSRRYARAGHGVRAEAGGAVPRPAVPRADVRRARAHAEPPLRLADPRSRRPTDLRRQPPPPPPPPPLTPELPGSIVFRWHRRRGGGSSRWIATSPDLGVCDGAVRLPGRGGGGVASACWGATWPQAEASRGVVEDVASALDRGICGLCSVTASPGPVR